jgi:ribosomal protein S18 acetylase RimI-like enzyme
MPLTHRPYRDAADLDGMSEVLFAGAAASPHCGYMHPGDLQWASFGPHGYPLAEILHLWMEGDTVLGWSLVSSADGFDYQVVPDLRGSPLERTIVEWTQAAIGKWRERNGLPPLCIVEKVFAGDHARITLLRSLGYTPSGRGAVYFTRPLDQLPEPPALPARWQVRGLRDADIDSRATCQSEAFAPGSRTTPATWRHLMTHSPGYHADLDTVVVTPDGIVATAALAWLDEHNKIGEFEPVGTRPAFQRMGCGRAALLRGLSAMRARGMTTAIVSTNATNAPAIALYKSVGFIERSRPVDYVLRPGEEGGV